MYHHFVMSVVAVIECVTLGKMLRASLGLSRTSSKQPFPPASGQVLSVRRPGARDSEVHPYRVNVSVCTPFQTSYAKIFCEGC